MPLIADFNATRSVPAASIIAALAVSSSLSFPPSPSGSDETSGLACDPSTVPSTKRNARVVAGDLHLPVARNNGGIQCFCTMAVPPLALASTIRPGANTKELFISDVICDSRLMVAESGPWFAGGPHNNPVMARRQTQGTPAARRKSLKLAAPEVCRHKQICSHCTPHRRLQFLENEMPPPKLVGTNVADLSMRLLAYYRMRGACDRFRVRHVACSACWRRLCHASRVGGGMARSDLHPKELYVL